MKTEVLILLDGSVELHPHVELPKPSGREMLFSLEGQDSGKTLFRLAFDPRTTHGVRVWSQA